MTVIIYYEKENNIFTLEELKNYLISNMCNEYQCFVYSDKNVLLKKNSNRRTILVIFTGCE